MSFRRKTRIPRRKRLLQQTEECSDYVTCGLCGTQFEFEDILSFIEHKPACQALAKRAQDSLVIDKHDETSTLEKKKKLEDHGQYDDLLSCQKCSKRFKSYWGVVQHVQNSHGLTIYRVEDTKCDSSNSISENDLFDANSKQEERYEDVRIPINTSRELSSSNLTNPFVQPYFLPWPFGSAAHERGEKMLPEISSNLVNLMSGHIFPAWLTGNCSSRKLQCNGNACFLCGKEFSSKSTMLEHFYYNHMNDYQMFSPGSPFSILHSQYLKAFFHECSRHYLKNSVQTFNFTDRMAFKISDDVSMNYPCNSKTYDDECLKKTGKVGKKPDVIGGCLTPLSNVSTDSDRPPDKDVSTCNIFPQEEAISSTSPKLFRTFEHFVTSPGNIFLPSTLLADHVSKK